MKTGTKSQRNNSKREVRRYILVVDGDGGAAPLKAAWRQLYLSDDLRVVTDPETAIGLLQEAAGGGAPSVAAVVLDPDTTGAETGHFLCRARAVPTANPVPMVLWSRDGAKYAALKKNGVASLVRKPMVLRVVQVLDAACGLRRHPFAPFAGGTLARQ